MKTIGIIGGLGPPSTVKYYEWLNEGVYDALGENHSAKIILTSLDGEDIKQLRIKGDLDTEGAFYASEAKRLEKAGADFILIASNTSHRNAPYIEKEVSIPLLHLADATAQYINSRGYNKVLLLGTSLTMEEDFYKGRLVRNGLNVSVPDKHDRDYMSEVIYNELVKGQVRAEVNDKFEAIIKKFPDVECVILGCTELTLLNLNNIPVPLFDTIRIHVDVALNYALE